MSVGRGGGTCLCSFILLDIRRGHEFMVYCVTILACILKLIFSKELFTYYIIQSEGREGKAKYDDHIIDGGWGLKTVPKLIM